MYACLPVTVDGNGHGNPKIQGNAVLAGPIANELIMSNTYKAAKKGHSRPLKVYQRNYSSLLLCNTGPCTNKQTHTRTHAHTQTHKNTHLLFDDIVPQLCFQIRGVNINKAGLLHLCWMIIRHYEIHTHEIALPGKEDCVRLFKQHFQANILKFKKSFNMNC